jgi:hypothetical protein
MTEQWAKGIRLEGSLNHFAPDAQVAVQAQAVRIDFD